MGPVIDFLSGFDCFPIRSGFPFGSLQFTVPFFLHPNHIRFVLSQYSRIFRKFGAEHILYVCTFTNTKTT